MAKKGERIITSAEFETRLRNLKNSISILSSGTVIPKLHGPTHNFAGSDPVTALNGSVLTSGTIDGNRLPAISVTKKGGVPATGAPAGKWLKDDGNWRNIYQGDVIGLRTIDTPQFAGLGIKTAGGDNRINLIEGAIVGVAAGPYQKYNAAAKLYEMLGADVNIGNTPTQPGTGGTWSMVYDSDTSIIYKLLSFNGDLYAAGGNGVYRRSAGTWARVLTVASAYCHTLCIFNSQLYAFFRSTGYIYRTSNGTDWTNVTPVGWPDFAGSASIVWNGVMYVSIPWGEVWHTTNGTSWTQTMARADDMQYGWGFAILGSNLYVAMGGATQGAIYKFNGTTWTRVLLVTVNNGFTAIYTWNDKLYAGEGLGNIYSSVNGTDWSAPVSIAGNVRAFIEYSGKLLATSNDKVYETSDGLTWAAFYDSPETKVYCFAFYGDILYLGTSTAGKIYAYTDATYIPAPNLQVFGHQRLWGQFRPGNAAGIKGSLLLSDAPSYNKWLAPGVAKTYVAAPATPGNDPVYQVIPATDLWATAADKIFGRATAGAGYGEEIACTAFGRSLIDDANAAAAATTLGLGTTDGPAFAHLHLTDVPATGGALITAAESWIGPSALAGIYFKGGNVGIGTMTPAYILDLVGSQRITGTLGVGAIPISNYLIRATRSEMGATAAKTLRSHYGLINMEVAANMTDYSVSGEFVISKEINAGITDSGYMVGLSGYAFRNYVYSLGTNDNGTLAALYGNLFGYGHFNTTAGATPITTNVYGINLVPYIRTGIITNLYDFFIQTPSVGGTVTNHWGIYQVATTAKNYFGGSVGIGIATPNANAILDITSTTKAFMPPRMTTAQRDAIASPTEGMVIFNITTHVLNSYYTSWAAV